jgi:hypothetical protein
MQNSLMSGGGGNPADEGIGEKRNQDEGRDNSEKTAGNDTKQQRTLVKAGEIEQNICEHREETGNPPANPTNLLIFQYKGEESAEKKPGINARAARTDGKFDAEKVERARINLVADTGVKGGDSRNNEPQGAFTGNGRQYDAEAPHEYRHDEKEPCLVNGHRK